MDRLFNAHIQLIYEDERGKATVNSVIARRTEFWWNPKRPDESTLWESKIECFLAKTVFNRRSANILGPILTCNPRHEGAPTDGSDSGQFSTHIVNPPAAGFPAYSEPPPPDSPHIVNPHTSSKTNNKEQVVGADDGQGQQ